MKNRIKYLTVSLLLSLYFFLVVIIATLIYAFFFNFISIFNEALPAVTTFSDFINLVNKDDIHIVYIIVLTGIIYLSSLNNISNILLKLIFSADDERFLPYWTEMTLWVILIIINILFGTLAFFDITIIKGLNSSLVFAFHFTFTIFLGLMIFWYIRGK